MTRSTEFMDSFSTVHTARKDLQQSKVSKPKNHAADLVTAFTELIPERQPELKRELHNGLVALMAQISLNFTDPPSNPKDN